MCINYRLGSNYGGWSCTGGGGGGMTSITQNGIYVLIAGGGGGKGMRKTFSSHFPF